MPYDGTEYRPTFTLADLAALLRDRSRWPKGFKWDYEDCEACAIGLYMKYVGKSIFDFSNLAEALAHTAQVFNMPQQHAMYIFFYLNEEMPGKYYELVTPEVVASAIDEYLIQSALANSLSSALHTLLTTFLS